MKTAMLLLLVLLPVWAAHGGGKTNLPPAKLKVRGYGLFGNLRLQRLIKVLEFPDQKPTAFDANLIEDAELILADRLQSDGYLRPVITVELTLGNGHKLSYTREGTMAAPLPRPLQVVRACFHIQKGVLYHYTRLQFTGLDAIPESRARAFFIETSGLIPLNENRVFSPERLDRSTTALREALAQLGFQQVKVSVTHLDRDDRTGDVAVEIRVEQGPRFMVRSVRQEVFFENAAGPVDLRTNRLHRPYSRLWVQDFTQGIKTNYFRQGYPEVSVDLQPVRRETTDNEVFLDLLAKVHPGRRVRAGKVDFVGNRRTRTSLLRRRVPLKPGTWLDRMKAEDGQYRLSRLGVFDSVDVKYQTVDSNLWNVTYDVKEGKRIEISPLFGFGSYDLLRGGVEIDQYNLWGLAHNQRLRLVQSFKSSSGDYTYNIPEVFGADMDFFLNGSGLRREEVSFTRIEYGGGAGVRRLFRRIYTDTTLRYNYGRLQASGTSTNVATVGAQNPLVGELIADINHDRRDNPLFPRKGYQVLGNFEFASKYFGGEVTYQRVEVAASYHWPLNASEWLHFKVSQGVAATIGGTSADLPFTRRFFPGGANSVRGYPEGEAAPRNAQGQIVGAETYTLGTVQFEQALTPKWSIVAFIDGVEFAEHLGNYPGDEALFSAGGGISWLTVVGPIRVEYGYNLNPRPQDPVGTIQFSLGAPF